MTELESLIVLNLIDGLGSITIKRLLESFGSAEKVLATRRAELLQIDGIGPELARRLSDWKNSVNLAGEIEKIEKNHLSIVAFNDPAYPKLLKEIYDPPPILYVKGSLKEEDNYAIAVVGTRRCSHYGRMSSERLSAQIARLGLTVVSGLARGVDTAAHRGALSANGRTIAVLGSGLDRIYPPENRELAEDIAASGALISEFPLGTGPHRQNFPLRNRVISGLSLGIVVVEAAKRSGSLITASQALEQGRAVFAVPGRMDSYFSKGTNALIREGAKLVEGIEDICEEFPYLFAPEAESSAESEETKRPRPRLSREEEIVLNKLSAQERSIDEITLECKLPPAAVLASLLSLEIKRLAIQLPGKLFRKAL